MLIFYFVWNTTFDTAHLQTMPLVIGIGLCTVSHSFV